MKYIPPDKPDHSHVGYQQQVKEGNIKRIFDLVRSGKCRSRAEIVRGMNLSATSVSVLVDELTDRGLVEEVGPTQTSQPGRRPISLRLKSDARQMVIFTLSPDIVRYSLLDLDCNIIENHTISLSLSGLSDQEAGAACAKAFDALLIRRAKLFDPQRALMIGICFPGLYLQDSRLLFTRQVLGASLPVDAIVDFQARANLPIHLFSTVRGMAYAEKRYLDDLESDVRNVGNMVYVLPHLAVNCAIITNGDIYSGPFNVSGQIGHFTIDYRGRPCFCGNRGCLERYVSLTAITEDARQACIDAGTEPPEDFKELARRWRNEPALRESVLQSARLLAFGLYNVACSSGIRRLVLGGPIQTLGEEFLEEIDRAMRERKPLAEYLEFSYAQAGPDAHIIGTAQHFLDKVYTITM